MRTSSTISLEEVLAGPKVLPQSSGLDVRVVAWTAARGLAAATGNGNWEEVPVIRGRDPG